MEGYVVNVIKRNGKEVPFDSGRIVRAITLANEKYQDLSEEKILDVSSRVQKKCEKLNRSVQVEEIQDLVENELIKINAYRVAKHYIKYRYQKELERDRYSKLIEGVKEKLEARNVQNQNANLDEASFGGRLNETNSLLMKQYALDYCMSATSKNNHLNNEIYIHDLDHYPLGDHNCMSMPIDKLLAEGFNTRQTDVRPSSGINTALQLVAVLFQLQSLQQFGGVSATHLDWSMVPYVRKSFVRHYKNGLHYLDNDPPLTEGIKERLEKPADFSITDPVYESFSAKTNKYASEMTWREVYQAAEALYHNLNTLQSRSGCQLPFSSINYGTCTLEEGRMVTRALLELSIKGIGKFYRTSIFPCGIFQLMKGVNRAPGDPNYDLFRLALKSTSLRLYPNYANCDWSGNAGYDINDPKTYFSTMGKRKLQLI